MKDKIEKVIEWTPVLSIPSKDSKTYHALGGMLAGCYQFALAKDIEDIGDDILHEKIGYTGKANDVFSRTAMVRAPKGNHGVRHYIDQFGIDRSEIVVRYLITKSADDISPLETYIHEQTKICYGSRFAWKEASGGVDGSVTYIISLIQNLDDSSKVVKIVQEARQIALRKFTEEMNNESI